MKAHPTDVELLDLLEGRLNPVHASVVGRHLGECPACQARQARLAELAQQVGDALVGVAGTLPFSAGPAWDRLAPRLRTARRAARVVHGLQLAASALVLLLAAGIIGLGTFLRSQPAAEPAATSVPVVGPTAAPTAAISPTPTPRPPAAGRITLLLVGMDRRPGETGAGLADSLLLLSMDRTRHTALMLSIPRDVWVDIPGHPPGRINTVYALGEDSGVGGAALLKQTTGALLGVRVDHVVRLEFGAVVTLIDAVGGVDVDVPLEIDDPTFPDAAYGYDPLYIPAGQQHLDGTLALKYMRTRHGSNDFERAARQQQVLTAIRQKLARLDTWPELLKRAPELLAQLQAAIATDLNMADLLDLAQQARDMPDQAVRMAVLDGRYVVDYVTPEGAQVLLPLNDRISALVNDLFETGLVPATPEIEMARLSVLNGTLRAGLAGQTADLLRGQGYNVVEVGNADNFEQAHTLIVDHAGRPATVKALSELLNVAPGSLVYRPDPAAPAEVEVILGADFLLPKP